MWGFFKKSGEVGQTNARTTEREWGRARGLGCHIYSERACQLVSVSRLCASQSKCQLRHGTWFTILVQIRPGCDRVWISIENAKKMLQFPYITGINSAQTPQTYSETFELEFQLVWTIILFNMWLKFTFQCHRFSS